MTTIYVGKVFINGVWWAIVESDDKAYVEHCLMYNKYDGYEKKVVESDD